jgi:integrase family protein with SAM-like domain
MSVALDSDTPPIATAVDAVLHRLAYTRALTTQSERRLRQVVRHFQSFAAGLSIHHLNDACPEHVRSFVLALGTDGRAPSTATMHLRRSAVRLLFATARQLQTASHDPTLDLRLPPRSSLHHRPLTDDEVAVCRSFAGHKLSETRRPAAWALAEATARTSEIPHVVALDIDPALRRVWIHDGSKTDPRWGHLSEWGMERLEERLRGIPGGAPLAYEGDGSGESRQASSCAAIKQTLQRAGLGSEPDVGPSSVAAWAGARAFREGAPIEAVARLLGMRSLDRTARFIGWDWTQEH